MSKDGFRARVKIDSVELGTGFHGTSSRDVATIEMSGAIQHCHEAGFHFLSIGEKRTLKTFAKATVCFGEDSLFVRLPHDLEGPCIGSMTVNAKAEEDFKSHDGIDLRADLQMVLTWDFLPRLLALREHELFVEPVFYRKGDAKDKETKISKRHGITSYIERVYFSPFIPDPEKP